MLSMVQVMPRLVDVQLELLLLALVDLRGGRRAAARYTERERGAHGVMLGRVLREHGREAYCSGGSCVRVC